MNILLPSMKTMTNLEHDFAIAAIMCATHILQSNDAAALLLKERSQPAESPTEDDVEPGVGSAKASCKNTDLNES